MSIFDEADTEADDTEESEPAAVLTVSTCPVTGRVVVELEVEGRLYRADGASEAEAGLLLGMGVAVRSWSWARRVVE